MSEETPNLTSELSKDLSSKLPDLAEDNKPPPELTEPQSSLSPPGAESGSNGMGLSEANLTSGEAIESYEPSLLTNVPPKKKQRKDSFWVKFWWIPVTFLVPFAVFYEYMGSYAHLNMAGSFRSGAIGLAVAGLIYGLWRLDQSIGKKEQSSSSGSDKKAFHFDPMLGMLGILLWLGWVSAAHIMIVAHDEVTATAAMADR
jgi:hypothetical protein